MFLKDTGAVSGITAGLMLLFCLAAGRADAGEEMLPKWEFMVGAGLFSLPQYMGSDERYSYPFAFPYLIYRGERWRLDRAGLQNRLLERDRISLDLSLSGGLPVYNSNRARSGMPGLDLTGEFGPKLNLLLFDSEHERLRFCLPSRAAINVRLDHVGWVTDPYLSYLFRMPLNGTTFRIEADAGLLYGSQRYHETYYDVPPQYVTANRPQYHAAAGLHSAFIKTRIQYPVSRQLQLFASGQYRNLSVGVIADSPLVKSAHYATITFGAMWLYATSQEMVRWDE